MVFVWVNDPSNLYVTKIIIGLPLGTIILLLRGNKWKWERTNTVTKATKIAKKSRNKAFIGDTSFRLVTWPSNVLFSIYECWMLHWTAFDSVRFGWVWFGFWNACYKNHLYSHLFGQVMMWFIYSIFPSLLLSFSLTKYTEYEAHVYIHIYSKCLDAIVNKSYRSWFTTAWHWYECKMYSLTTDYGHKTFLKMKR